MCRERQAANPPNGLRINAKDRLQRLPRHFLEDKFGDFAAVLNIRPRFLQDGPHLKVNETLVSAYELVLVIDK